MVDKTHRNQCRACRLQRCLNVGMNRDAVQHERGPRNSTLRRQMSMYFRESPPPSNIMNGAPPSSLFSTPPPISSSSSFLPPSITPPIYATPLSTRPSPPFSVTPPAMPAAMATPLSYHLHMSLMNEARRHQGLLMPTPKYPESVTPPTLAAPPPLMLAPPPPPPAPPKDALESINELAARLLFMNVKWAQNVPAFTSLPYRDQMLLLAESWRELFVLSSAQFGLPVELSSTGIQGNEALLGELKNLQDAIQKFQAMNVDSTEFACLRAIILLKTHIESNGDDAKELRDNAAINALQDQAQLTLSKYINSAYPGQPSRFGKLLLLLPSLKAITGKSIESIFFKKTIGEIPIEKIICDMYKAGSV